MTPVSLTKCANDELEDDKRLFVSMSSDEMSIRRHIQWVHNQKYFSGLITYGERNDDEVPIANNAIFFLL